MNADCRISDIVYDQKSCRPTILNFQNGKLIDGKETDLTCNIYQNKKGEFITAVASNNILYSGEINREDEGYNNFIAIRNRKTNKMRLIAIDNVVLKAQLPKSREIMDSTMMEEKTTTMIELNKQFGSKKSKRATEQMERMKLNIENVKEQLEQTVADIKIDTNDIKEATDDFKVASYIPPINREASNILSVYKLKKIVPSVVLESLTEEANRVLEADEDDIKTCDYIKKEIIKLQSSPSDTKLDSTKLLLFMDNLIKMVIQPAKIIATRSFVACAYSEPANTHIFENYTVRTTKGRTRPTSMRDKSVCYVLVLAMLAGNYQINLEELGQVLKLGIKKLQEYSKILSFSIHYKDTKIAELKLPLPPPMSNKKSPNKRKK